MYSQAINSDNQNKQKGKKLHANICNMTFSTPIENYPGQKY